jgi:hypothetical protein
MPSPGLDGFANYGKLFVEKRCLWSAPAEIEWAFLFCVTRALLQFTNG